MKSVNQTLRPLTVYDPDICERTFELPSGEIWSNRQANILVFESDAYSIYTSSRFLNTLSTCLIQQCPIGRIGIRTTDTRVAPSLSWASERYVSDEAVTAIVELPLHDRLFEVFDETADYGIWDFYGLPPEFRDLEQLETIPEVLKRLQSLPFVIEVDLDGILIGFASVAHCGLDNLVQKLEQLS